MSAHGCGIFRFETVTSEFIALSRRVRNLAGREHSLELIITTGRSHFDCLTIVIPTLNEEGAIGGTITRCQAASETIMKASGLSDIEIIVVSDGSTDGTVEIARSFDGVKVIVFEENRGYGAAIKEGFRLGRGALVGFIDADGTVTPFR